MIQLQVYALNSGHITVLLNSCLRGIIAYNADYRKCDGVSSSSFQFCDANSCRDNTTCQQFGDSNVRITQCLPEINGAMKQGQNKCLLFPSIFYSLMIQDVCRARALSFDASISLADCSTFNGNQINAGGLIERLAAKC